MPLKIVRNNIVNMEADAIVNSANHLPIIGSGVDMSIYKAAGIKELLAERSRIGVIHFGAVEVTPAFNLKAKYIFHTVTPIWRGGSLNEEELLRSCYVNIMGCVIKYNCESVAIPLLATGNNAYPKGLLLRLATEVITSYLDGHDIMVYLVVYDKASFTVAGKLFADIESMLDESDLKENRLDEDYEYFEYLASNRNRMEKYIDAMYEEVVCHSLEHSEQTLGAGKDKARPKARPKAAYKKKISGAELDEVLDKLLKRALPISFSEKLFKLIEERGLAEVEVYKNANMDRKLFSKLRRKNYNPSKNTVIALGISLRLSLNEIEDLLRQAGYALAPNNSFDRIVGFCIEKEVYNIHEVNIALFNFTGMTIN